MSLDVLEEFTSVFDGVLHLESFRGQHALIGVRVQEPPQCSAVAISVVVAHNAH